MEAIAISNKKLLRYHDFRCLVEKTHGNFRRRQAELRVAKDGTEVVPLKMSKEGCVSRTVLRRTVLGEGKATVSLMFFSCTLSSTNLLSTAVEGTFWIVWGCFLGVFLAQDRVLEGPSLSCPFGL